MTGDVPSLRADPPADDLTAQARDLPLDSHLHTDLSPDSDVPIDDYAAQAAERHIDELAITDHVDFAPGAPAYDFVPFFERERVVRDAADRWAARGVAIRFGVEITYDRRYEAEIREHLAGHAYDYVIGSVHVYADSPFHASRVAAWTAGRPLAEIVAPYFDEVLRAIRSGLFDTIGHLDFVKRYLVPHVSPARLAEAPELYEPLLDALIETGTALEVNTSGLWQASHETYPAAPIVERYRVLGGTRVSAGSDAHRSGAFTMGLAEGYRVVAGAGLGELAFRRGGSSVAVTLPDRFLTSGAREGQHLTRSGIPSL
ncbi:MAG TPA: histidinol-phosphatase HisJ family protein [Candidatus Bathyarchaeia archaeon]|nr:histidinol-phosphatase HisJ family protein [Candidatus Bathyarchaeia archaeon]